MNGMAAVLALASLAAAVGDDDRVMVGRVVDESGGPVSEVTVAESWSANGDHRAEDGGTLDLTVPEELRLFWGRLGEMDARDDSTESASDGTFRLPLGSSGHHAMAIDARGRRGGIAMLPARGEGGDVEIVLRPLVHVRGRMEGVEGGGPDWAHIYTNLPEDPTRPVDSTRLISCGSFSGEFEMWLPPGTYTFDAYGISDADSDEIDLWVEDEPTLTVTGERAEVDLGVLRLERDEQQLAIAELLRRNRAGEGEVLRYGERPPPLDLHDARGVASTVQPWDYPGKWTLLNFWGTDCPVCLTEHMPELIAFDRAHAEDRDRFQILSVFNDLDGEIRTVADFERHLAPIVEHVWGGEDLPFPVLIDPSTHNYERYNLQGYPSDFLIDPRGRLVEGDLQTLEQILEHGPEAIEADRPRD